MSGKILPRSEYNSTKDDGRECVFCERTIEQGLEIRVYKHWIWEYCVYPYFKFHTLLVPKRHIICFSELSNEEALEFKEIMGEIEKAYFDKGIVNKSDKQRGNLLISWRMRADETIKPKTRHLHVHIYPEQDGFIEDKIDPEAHKIDTSILRSSTM